MWLTWKEQWKGTLNIWTLLLFHTANLKGRTKIRKTLLHFLTCNLKFPFSSVHFSCSVVTDSLRPHKSQHARPPCPSPSPRGTQTHIHRVGDAIQPSRPLLSQCCPSCQCRRLRDVSLIPWSRRSSEGSAIPWTEEPCGLQSMGLQSRTWLNDLAACTGKVYPHRLPYLTDLLGSLTWMGIQTLFRASSPEQLIPLALLNITSVIVIILRSHDICLLKKK